MNVLVDTNVLVRLASPGGPQRDEAIRTMQALVDRQHVPAVVSQVIYEYWVVATRPIDPNGLGLSVQQSLDDWRKFDTDFEFLPDSPDVFVRWRTLVEERQIKGKPAHDARLVTAILRHDITHLLTFNAQDLSRFGEITVVTPADAADLPPASPSP